MENELSTDQPEETSGFIQTLFQKLLSLLGVGGEKEVSIENQQEEERLILGQEFIMRVLPHRGRMLLLDRTIITKSKILGEFLVTNDVCEGHSFEGKLVFRGVDLIDMAAQLAGVWYVSQRPELLGKLAYLRKSEARFNRPIFPGESVVVELNNNNIGARTETSRRGSITHVEGKEFLIKVGGQLRAVVSSMELASFEAPKIEAPKT